MIPLVIMPVIPNPALAGRLVLPCALLACGSLQATVVPNALFSSHAVLQREVELPVWGTAADGEKITVRIAGQTATTTARDGKWQVRLKPMKASATPQNLTITGTNTITLEDILIGDVWLCGGQSNMEWSLAKSADGKAVAAKVSEPDIRLFRVPKGSAAEPATSLNGAWTPCDARNAAYFSAVGYYFGRDLHQALGVPVGLIGSYVGGTPAESWTSRKAMTAHPDLKGIVESQQRAEQAYDPVKAQANHQAAMLKYQQAADAAKAAGKPAPKPPQPAANPKGRGPSSLYNAMIAPLQPYAIRGVIWYQGESNRGNVARYAKLFPALIADWRAAWQQPDLPFLFVQLAPYGAIPPELREVQTNVWKNTPHTGMAVITDHGSASNIHPPAKDPVGRRLALAARAVAYGEKITSSGPVYESMKIHGSKAVIRFTSTDTGLRDEADLKGFTIAGPDGKFVPAVAVVAGDTVEVSSPSVSQPAAVRFGWANVPEVNLFNREGLPAVPFRTDPPKPPHTDP
jgi:sialate O-acetylesterase